MTQHDFMGSTDRDLFGAEIAGAFSARDMTVLNGELVDEEYSRLIEGVPITRPRVKGRGSQAGRPPIKRSTRLKHTR